MNRCPRSLLLAVALLASSITALAETTPRWRDDWRSGASSRGIAREGLLHDGSLVLVGDRTGSSKGFVAGFDAATGARTFTHVALTQGEVAAEHVAARVGGSGFYVSGLRDYAYENLGFVSRYAANGERIWTVEFASDHAPLIAGVAADRLVIATWIDADSSAPAQSRLALLADADGTTLHQRQATGSVFTDLSASAGDVYARSAWAVARYDGSSLQQRWQVVPAGARTFGPIDTGPDGTLVTGAFVDVEGGSAPALVGLDPANGSERWRSVSSRTGYFPTSDVVVVAVAQGAWLLGGSSGSSRLLRGGPGLPVASSDIDLPLDGESIARDGSMLYVAGERDGEDDIGLLAFDTSAGSVAWSVVRPFATNLQLVAANDRIAFVQGRNGQLQTEILLRSNGDGATPLAAMTDGRLQGHAIPGPAASTFAVASDVGDDGPSMTVRRYDANGAVVWERRSVLPFAESTSVERAMLKRASDGSVIAWMSAWNDGSGVTSNQYGGWQLVCLEPDTGALRWSTGLSSGGWQSPRVYAAAVEAGADAAVHVVAAQETLDQFGLPVVSYELRRYRIGDGSIAWTRTVNAAAAMLGTSAGLVVAGSSVAPGIGGFALYASVDGSTVWSRPVTSQYLEFARFAALPGGDVVVAYNTTSGSRRDVSVERLSPLDGTRRWVTPFGVNNGVHDEHRSLLVRADGTIFVGGRFDNIAVGRAFLARLAFATGAVDWLKTMPSGLTGHSGSQLALSPAGDVQFKIATESFLSDYTCSVCQSHVVRVDAESGTTLGWHHVGTEVASGYGSASSYLALEAAGAERVLSGIASADGDRVLSVAGFSEPVFRAGSAYVEVLPGAGLDAVDGIQRREIVVRVGHDATTVVRNLVLMTRADAGAVLSQVSCTMLIGTGACGTTRVDGSLRQLLDLEPDAVAEIRATLQFPPGVATTPLTAIVAMPFEFGALDPTTARTTLSVVATPLLANGFE